MHFRAVYVAVVTFAAMAGCTSSMGIADCGANTTAAFRDEIAISATVTSIKSAGPSTRIEVGMDGAPPGKMSFIVADTTAVFERIGEGAPRASSACHLAVGEVVEIPLGDGFGDIVGDVPPPTLRQLVIER
ncbi:MAG: hypothetical protein M3Y30_04080 [Gemmatimonadota bacterium]|nr:hypothetical protein [Gemmatimonadota bacterium]